MIITFGPNRLFRSKKPPLFHSASMPLRRLQNFMSSPSGKPDDEQEDRKPDMIESSEDGKPDQEADDEQEDQKPDDEQDPMKRPVAKKRLPKKKRHSAKEKAQSSDTTAPMKRPSAEAAPKILKRPSAGATSATPKQPKTENKSKKKTEGNDVETFVDNLLDRHALHLQAKLEAHCCAIELEFRDIKANWEAWPTPIRMASACSGSEVVCLAADAWAESTCNRLRFETVFTCDIGKTPQDWLLLNGLQGGCLFGNIKDLKNDKAWCWKHRKYFDVFVYPSAFIFLTLVLLLCGPALGHLPLTDRQTDRPTDRQTETKNARYCKVVGCDCFVYGFSCTSVASINNDRASHKGTLADEDAESATAQTFYGGMGYVKVWRPLFVIMENVLGLAAAGDNDDQALKKKSNLEIACQKYLDIGYDVLSVFLNSKKFALPQDRRRIYIIAVNRQASDWRVSPGNCKLVNHRMHTLLPLLSSSVVPNLSEFLLANDHPRVLEALEALKLAETTRDWTFDRSKHREHCRQEKVKWPLSVQHTALKQSPWVAAMPPRQVDCVAFIEAKFGYSVTRVVHVAPSLDRVWTTDDGTCKTIVPVGAIFHMGLARLLLGEELLSMQGFPYSRVPCWTSFSSSQIAGLAGNAFSGTVIQSMIAAVTSCTTFTTESEDEQDEIFSSAMAALDKQK